MFTRHPPISAQHAGTKRVFATNLVINYYILRGFVATHIPPSPYTEQSRVCMYVCMYVCMIHLVR
ncbi:MAG: hypothetical protein LUD39_06045 [Opitutae bacterium]|nr:hypothetical protein [Opitutae bacterium]